MAEDTTRQQQFWIGVVAVVIVLIFLYFYRPFETYLVAHIPLIHFSNVVFWFASLVGIVVYAIAHWQSFHNEIFRNVSELNVDTLVFDTLQAAILAIVIFCAGATLQAIETLGEYFVNRGPIFDFGVRREAPCHIPADHPGGDLLSAALCRARPAHRLAPAKCTAAGALTEPATTHHKPRSSPLRCRGRRRSGRRGRRRIDEVVEHGKRALDAPALQAVHDEDETRAPVGVGPLFQVARRMDDVLNAVDQHGGRHAGDVQKTLEAQHVGAVTVQQHARPDAERRPIQRAVERDHEGLHRLGVIARPVRVLADFLRGPVARLAKFAFGVVDVVGEQTMEAPPISLESRMCAETLSARSRARSAATNCPSHKSVLVRTSRSAIAICLTASGKPSIWAAPLTASTVVTMPERPEMVAQDGLGQQRVGDRRRIRQSGSLDDDPAEIRHLAARSPRQLLAQRLLQVAAHRAAQAAVFQQQRAFGDALQQMMVESDFAEFVDEDENVATAAESAADAAAAWFCRCRESR